MRIGIGIGIGIGRAGGLLEDHKVTPVLGLLKGLRPRAQIAHHDPDLARQLRRASTAVALNVAEAWVARGRSRIACYNVALREMRESHTALEISVRLRYLPPLSADLEARCQRILGTLYKPSFPRVTAS